MTGSLTDTPQGNANTNKTTASLALMLGVRTIAANGLLNQGDLKRQSPAQSQMRVQPMMLKSLSDRTPRKLVFSLFNQINGGRGDE